MIPGLKDIFDANPSPKLTNLGQVVSGFFSIAVYAAVFVAFFFLLWGGFSWIMSQGNKESVAKARGRITWAIIGLIVILLAYLIAGFIGEMLPTIGWKPF